MTSGASWFLLVLVLTGLKSSSVDHWTSTAATNALMLRAEAFRRAITGRGRASPVTLAVSLTYWATLPTLSSRVTLRRYVRAGSGTAGDPMTSCDCNDPNHLRSGANVAGAQSVAASC